MSTLRAVLVLVACSACNSVIGLDEYTLASDAITDASTPGESCSTSADCADTQVCARMRCVTVASDDCREVIGPYRDEHAVLVGSLFATRGAQSATNLARERSVALAVEEINAAGGLPGTISDPARRPLALVGCDSDRDLARAGRHLIGDLGVPAILGPNTSQDTLDLATKQAIEAGTLLISPTAVSASIVDLLDQDLSWLMVPTDVQRGPIMLHQLAALESQLKSERGKTQLELSIVFRDDALGQGSRVALNDLEWNGRPLADPPNLNGSITITPYDPSLSPQTDLVRSQLQLAPDVVVLIGTAEAVTDIMAPLERGWTSGPRPHYLLIDSSKVPELLALVRGNADLRARVRGTGVTAEGASRPIFEAFERAFNRRYPGQPATISGMGPAYDAAYALAYALAATRELPVSGQSIARGLRELGTGATIEVGSAQLQAAFGQLASGGIRALGTFGPLQWNEYGAVLGGTIEVWCVNVSAGSATFASGGLTYDLEASEVRGRYTGCEAPVGAPPQAEPPEAPGLPVPEPAAPPNGTPAADGGMDVDAGPGAVPPADPVPPAAPTAIDIGLSAQYMAFNDDPRDNVISPSVRVTNRSATDGIALASIRVRYYFTNEHAELCPEGCVVEVNWAGIQPTGVNVQARSRYVAEGGTTYLEISFPRNAPTLPLNSYVEVQQQFHTDPYQPFDESDDYSFDRRRTGFADSEKITVHQNETRVWGTPPE